MTLTRLRALPGATLSRKRERVYPVSFKPLSRVRERVAVAIATDGVRV
jgi:hypothetical protein